MRRKRCAEDRRQVLCFIVPEGLELLARLDDPMLQGDASVQGSLGRPALDSLIQSLDAVRTGVEKRRTLSK